MGGGVGGAEGRAGREPRARTRSGAQLASYDCLLTKFGMFLPHHVEARIFPFLTVFVTILQDKLFSLLTNSFVGRTRFVLVNDLPRSVPMEGVRRLPLRQKVANRHETFVSVRVLVSVSRFTYVP